MLYKGGKNIKGTGEQQNNLILQSQQSPRGTSDPYVKFKIAGKEVFRSKTIHKNLNPVWDERVCLLVETLKDPLYVKVFDYDFGLQDDFMGSAYLHLESLEHHRTLDVTLDLKDPQYPEHNLGSLELAVTLSPKEGDVRDAIQNGERKAYVLKSKELTGPTKGVIFLEIDVIFNATDVTLNFSNTAAATEVELWAIQHLNLQMCAKLLTQGPRILQGQGVEPRLIDTDLLLKSSLIFYALFHGSYDSAYECVSFPIAHMVGIGDPVPVLASGGCAEKLVRAGGEIVRGEARSAREWDSSMCRGQKRIEKKTRGKRLSNYFKQHTKLKHCAEPSKGQHPERCGFPAVWGEGNAKGISAELTLKASAARGVCLGACCCCFVYTVTAAVAVCRFFCLNPELKPHRSNKQREIYIALAMLTLLSHDSIFSSARRFAVAFMNMELPFSPPPPAFSSSSTPASPLSSPPAGLLHSAYFSLHTNTISDLRYQRCASVLLPENMHPYKVLS
ncbi:Multiple C2 and transmembrane domain-containing protein 1 [Collichthys lucidus]|uniref:Multiple C2 and transmembrane domain-containing protein 1 n=1 Tax=Collichthys lucidus TaxID=240159 RepID=A0A4V6ARC3_COLLU|nr:Multiple C2 and transmembrane domain-containing protein 1 [Collichthys lucidus]